MKRRLEGELGTITEMFGPIIDNENAAEASSVSENPLADMLMGFGGGFIGRQPGTLPFSTGQLDASIETLSDSTLE